MTDFAGARRAMVDCQLRPQGVTNASVLAAMATVPREDHVPATARAFTYFDRLIPVEDGVMLPPAAMGRLLDAATPLPGERALVVSAAPGYAAAILAAIGLDVATIAPRDLAGETSPSQSFDLILIEGAVAELPEGIADALNEGGRIATCLLAPGGVARLSIGRKTDGELGFLRFADCEIPALAEFLPKPAFSF